MATTSLLIPVEEYLKTMYRPDCDYVDGEVRERNMGEKPHSRLQKFILRYFEDHEDEWQFEALQEQRLQINATHYRVPDILLTEMHNDELRIVYTAPMLCVEVLSSEDRMSDIQERIDEYALIGVPASWVVDPWRYLAYAAGPDGKLQTEDELLTVPNSPIQIAVPAIWAELDRLKLRAAATK